MSSTAICSLKTCCSCSVLIYARSGKNVQVKIIDFGLATIVDPSSSEVMTCGSPGYLAPEVYSKEGYGTKADIFSLGVILYVSLLGDLPFDGSIIQEIVRNNRECNVRRHTSDWARITPEGKDLTLRMLEKDPRLRITAKEALDHPWFMLEQTEHNKLSIAQENMQKYCNGGRFNVERIKPEFGLLPASPVHDSCDSPGSSGSLLDWEPSPKAKKGKAKEVLIPRLEELDKANFGEDEIAENGEIVTDRVSSPINKSSVPSVSLQRHGIRKDPPKTLPQSTEVLTPESKSCYTKNNALQSFDHETFAIKLFQTGRKEDYHSPAKLSCADCFSNMMNAKMANTLSKEDEKGKKAGNEFEMKEVVEITGKMRKTTI
eukprot:TRINITY_DN12739_c0_g1_i4.p1 TRINITY_DN12739_c0_g1~~TRINITY_DN12739_c0_g1_i4.p1  ORF type:complete len:374 (-),score=83.88 TRINITY_DN12739_c0_g1_i4:70-1191(-)